MRYLVITTLAVLLISPLVIAAVAPPLPQEGSSAYNPVPDYGYSNYGYRNWYRPYRPYYSPHRPGGYSYAYPRGPYGYYSPRYYGYRYPYNYYDYRYNYFPRYPFFYGPQYPRYPYWYYNRPDRDKDRD